MDDTQSAKTKVLQGRIEGYNLVWIAFQFQ